MNKRHSKAGIMLLEIMISICFFAVMIAICMQILIKALNISRSSTELNTAVCMAESAAEIYKSAGGDADFLLETYECPEGYSLDVQDITEAKGAGQLHQATITILNKNGKQIYQIDTSAYVTDADYLPAEDTEETQAAETNAEPSMTGGDADE